MGRFHIVTERVQLENGEWAEEVKEVPFTPEQEAARDAEEAAEAEKAARQQAAKESLDRMLAASGLTSDDLKKLLMG